MDFLKNNKKGFTLVELLVVITIIGILSSLATVSVNVARVKARDAKRKADISQTRLALYLYYDDNLKYPSTGEFGCSSGGGDSNCSWPEATRENWQELLVPALSGYPDQEGNPTAKALMVSPPIDPLNTEPYVYTYTSNGKEFVIQYYLEQGGPTEIHGY